MGFHDLMASASPNVSNCSEEARFSFLEGCYVEDLEPQGKFLSVTVFDFVKMVVLSFNCLVDYLVSKY